MSNDKIAEIERLRAEIERLRAENELHEARVVIIRQAGEIADLREDNERLRAARATSRVEIKEEGDGR